MKKFFRRSLACIIAVVMIATSLPFSAITANAATTTSITKDRFGCVTNGDSPRFSNKKFNIVNDAELDNTSAGVLHFDLTQFLYKEITNVKFNVAIESTSADTQIQYLNYYYSTSLNNDGVYLSKDGKETTGTKIGYGTETKAIEAYLKHFGGGTLLAQTARTAKTGSFDVTSQIKNVINSGKKDLYIIIMHSNAGVAGGGGNWSDTTVNPASINFSITYDDLSKEQKKSYVMNNINSFVPFTGGADAAADGSYSKSNLASHENGVQDTMANVLYAAGTTNAPYTKTVTEVTAAYSWPYNYNVKTGMQYGDIVFLYDGETTPSTVIMSYNACEASEGGMRLLVPQDGSTFSMPTNWHSSGNSGSKDYSTINWVYGPLGSRHHQFGNIGDYNRYWYNSLHYVGEPTSTITSFSDITYNITIFSLNGTYDNGAGTVKFGSTNTTNGTTTVYIVNYKPIRDAIIQMKQVYNTVQSNIAQYGETYYKPAALDSFYEAAFELMTFNPNNYSYASGVSSAVTSVGAKIDSLCSNYVPAATTEPELNLFTVKFTDSYNNVKSTKTVLYGSKIGDFPSNSAPQTHNDDPYFINEGQHVRFSWPTTYTADTVVTSDITIKEVSNAESCTGTATCTAKAVCTVCGLEFGAINPNNHDPKYEFKDYKKHIKTCSRCDKLNVEEAHTDDGTGHCQYCRHVLLDTSALDSAKTQAENILTVGNADGEYVKDTYQNLYDVYYNEVKDAVPTTQDQVNSLTSKLLTAISSLISANITITFITKEANGSQVGETQTITKKYGDTAELTVSDADVEKWEIVNNKGAENEVRTFVKTGQNTLSIVVSKDISVIAHLAENVSSQQNITKVVFMGRNNTVVAIKYIEPYDTFETRNVTIPAIPFYEENGWDKTEVVGLENGGEITVRAQYNFNVADADAHKCGIHFEKFDKGVRTYNYDSFVKLYGSSTYYGMYSGAVTDVTQDEAKTKLLTYFKTDEFYAPHNSDIYVYELPNDFTPTASVGVTGSYHDSNDTKDIAAFNCKFFVPDNAKVVEWGIKATADGTVYNFKSNNKTSRNEYTFKVNVPKTANISSVSAKAYIVYIDANDKRITLLSNNEVAINFN